jgi:formyl-CoA transferase
MSTPSKPLAGLKVIELGTLIAGPFASRICAEFGAEVIKVESPDGGDPLRKWRKLYEGTSLWWFVQARNKQSLTSTSSTRKAARCSSACWPRPTS